MTYVQLCPPLPDTDVSETVAVKLVTGLPPLSAGGVHVTVACAFPEMALTPEGAPGTPTVTAADGADGGDVPSTLVAVAEKV
jgi:hypothetical protein